MNTYIDFIVEFIKKPDVIGAIAPSSQCLAKKMTEWIDFNKVDVAVEYGPGSGTITRELLKKLKPKTTFFTIEINESMSKKLKINIPEVTVYKDSVVNVQTYLEKNNKKNADLIISSLPWATFSTQLQNKIIEKTLDILIEGGKFITYAYIHSTLLSTGKRFKDKLYQNFSMVSKSSVTFLNIPPAFVYRCEK